ncbi:MAG: hypothetical protein MR374_07365, partial [Clostridia bacterium]|nr:hypothetical protein [Clostridia bacterium]
KLRHRGRYAPQTGAGGNFSAFVRGAVKTEKKQGVSSLKAHAANCHACIPLCDSVSSDKLHYIWSDRDKTIHSVSIAQHDI